MEVADPFAFITTECHITASQHQLLSTTTFFRQDKLSAAAAAAKYGDDYAWPVSSDDDNNDKRDGLPLPVDNNVKITFCSVPCTPDNQHDVVPPHSGKFQAGTTINLNGVVSGNSVKFKGNTSTTGDLNDVVCADFDKLGFSVAGKRAGEESSVTPTAAAKKLRFCDTKSVKGIQNDVVRESSGDLGLRIAVENTKKLVNDVVGKDSNKLGLCTGERRAKENNKEVTDDVVSENSIDLGIKRDISTTNEKVVSPTTAEFVENTKTVQNDVVSDKFVGSGERNVTMTSPSTTKELRSPELNGAEMEVDIENTAKINCDTEKVDTEEVKEVVVISDNTEEFDTSESEGDDDNGNGDTEEVKKCENHGNSLMGVLKMLAERSRKDKDKEKEGDKVDFLETAKRRGYTFPKPRWMSS